MTAEYYILSTKCSLQTRETKHGVVYDVCFRVIDKVTSEEKQKKLCGYKTKTAAKQAHAEFITEYCELAETNPLKQKKKKVGNIPYVKDLFAEYILSLRLTNKESTIINKQLFYNKYVDKALGSKPITQLTADVLKEWQNQMLNLTSTNGKKLKTSTYLLRRMYMQAFLNWCESEYNFPNRLKEVKYPVDRERNKKNYSIWDEETFRKFIAVVEDPMYHAIFMTLFYTGRRKNEVLALTAEDIDFEKGTIRWNKSSTRKFFKDQDTKSDNFKITTTKRDKDQTLPICPILIEELKQYKMQSPFIFGGDIVLVDTYINIKFNKYCKIAKIKPIRVHDLRHSFASMLINNGEDYMVVAELIGDSVEQVLKTYGHIYSSAISNAVSKIGKNVT